MERLQFNIKYRGLIESGKYSVVTDWGWPVEIVKWECGGSYPILAVSNLGGGDPMSMFVSVDGITKDQLDKLYIVSDGPIFSEFEEAFVKEACEVHGAVVPVDVENVKESCSRLMAIAEREVELNLRAQLNADVPCWYHMFGGAAGGGDKEIYLIRNAYGSYFLSKSITDGDEYLLLESLEKLPGLPRTQK